MPRPGASGFKLAAAPEPRRLGSIASAALRQVGRPGPGLQTGSQCQSPLRGPARLRVVTAKMIYRAAALPKSRCHTRPCHAGAHAKIFAPRMRHVLMTRSILRTDTRFKKGTTRRYNIIRTAIFSPSSCRFSPPRSHMSECVARMHHSAHAHYRRAMHMDEGTFPTPAVLDFSNLMHESRTFEATLANSADVLAVGRDTVVSRNLSSIEKSAEIIQSVVNERIVHASC